MGIQLESFFPFEKGLQAVLQGGERRFFRLLFLLGLIGLDWFGNLFEKFPDGLLTRS